MSTLSLLAAITSSQPPSGGGGGGDYFTETNYEGHVTDTGRYDGYSFVDQHANGMISDLYMSRTSHFSIGPLMLMFSYNGGNGPTSFTTGQVKVDGVLTDAVALWKAITPTGRMLIGYQDDTVYQTVKFAYSDNPESRNFISSMTYDFGPSWVSSPCPIPAVIMPEGQIRFYYYKLGGYPTPVPGDPYVVGALETTDNGLTYVDNGEIICSNTAQAPDDFGNWKCHETTVVITHPGATNADTKMIAWCRVNFPDENSTYFMVYRTANGGATWTTDFTEDTGGPFVDDNGNNVGGPYSRHLNYTFLPGNNPARLHAHAGMIYAVVGERNPFYGYALKFSVATPDGAYRNRFDDWARPTLLRMYNANSLGGSIDCGYPCTYANKRTISDPDPQLLYHDYDSSTETVVNPAISTDALWVYQGIIYPLP